MNALTPEQFQSVALAWISAITVVGGAVTTFIIYIYGKVNSVKQATQDNAQRLDDHSRRITSNGQAVTGIALQLPPPPGAQPQQPQQPNPSCKI